MVNEKSTVEQIESYISALDVEAQGYKARAEAANQGKDMRLSAAELADRVKQVAAEKKRASALLAKAAKQESAEADGEEPVE